MKKANTQLFQFSKVYCRIFGHKLQVSKNVTNHIHEYQCKKCGVEMTDTANGLLARLTPKFRETNVYLAKFYKKRTQNLFSRTAS
jgi:hypothetical protein